MMLRHHSPQGEKTAPPSVRWTFQNDVWRWDVGTPGLVISGSWLQRMQWVCRYGWCPKSICHFLMVSEIQDPISTIEFFAQRFPTISREAFGQKILACSCKKSWCCHCQISKECQPVGLHLVVGDAYLYLLKFSQKGLLQQILWHVVQLQTQTSMILAAFAAEVRRNCCYSVEGTSGNPAIVWMAFLVIEVSSPWKIHNIR